MNSIYKILLDYISYAVNVGLASAWVYRSLRGSFRHRLVRNFYGAQRILIYLPLREQPERRMMIADEDFLAALDLSNFLRSYGIKLQLRRIPPTGAFDFEAHSIIICGPKTCEAVRDLYLADPSYRLEQHNGRWEIRDCMTGNYLISPMDQASPENKDLAYLARADVGGGKALLLGGIHAAGSYGAIRFLTNYSQVRKLFKEVGKRKFSAVLTTSFNAKTMNSISADIHLAISTH